MSSARPQTLDGLLAQQARATPDRAALILPFGPGFRTTSYARLDRRVDAVAAGLRAAGLEPGMRAALLVPPTEDFFTLAFALLRLRAVPVLVDPGIGRGNVKDCLGSMAPEAFVGVTKAHLARRVLGWAPTAHLSVVVGPGSTPWRACVRPTRTSPGRVERTQETRTLRQVEQTGRGLLPFTPATRPDGSPAAILFTSGSTGPPKGVEQGEEQLLAQATSITRLYGLTPDDVSLSTFPPFALFGPVIGMTTVVPRMDATKPASVKPERVTRAANRYAATVMFGSPALLDTVSRGGATMPTLRQVISAGAPVPRAVQRRTLDILATGTQIFTPYGATEALPVASIGSDELLGLPEDGICVGRPVPGVRVALIRVTDDPIATLSPADLVADGETGEVLVSGPVVSPGYADRPDATATAKVDWDGQTAHRMGDLASRDAEGRLWFAGRKVHVVHTPDGPLYSVPCEEVFNRHRCVRRCALVGVTDRPVLVVELEPGETRSPALTAELLALGAGHERTAGITDLRFHPGLPVDIRHNSKINRAALAVWAAR